MEQLLLILFFAILNCVLYGWIWFKTKTEAEIEPKAPRNPEKDISTPECEEETVEKHLPHLICKPERNSPSSTKVSQIGENTRTDESKTDHFQTPAISEEDFKRLEDDYKFFRKEISKFERQFLNLSTIISGFENIQQEKEKLNQEIASLQEAASKNDSDRQAIEWQLKKENSELHEKLDRLETENRTIACKLSFRECDTNENNIQKSDCKIPTNQKQKQQLTSTISNGNDKRAASLQETASKCEYDCLDTESRLITENNALKKKLDILKEDGQKKTAELSRVAEENRSLNSIFQLAIETLNIKIGALDLLNAELSELKGKYQSKSLLNYQLEEKLSASQDITFKWKADYEKITLENDDLKAKLVDMLDKNYNIKQDESTVDELKQKLSTYQLENDELKKSETNLRVTASQFELTISQLRKEIEDLKSETESHKTISLSMKSELERITGENNQFKSQMDSNKENHEAQLDQQKKDAASLLELNSNELEKEAIDLRKRIGFLQKENEQMWKTRESVVESAKKAEKMAIEQVEALSEALTALQEAAAHAKEVAAAEEAECVPGLAKASDMESKSTEDESENRLKKWLTNHGFASKKPAEENEMRNLLKSTGISMIKRAENLKQQAKNLKVKGKDLKKKARKLSRKSQVAHIPETHSVAALPAKKELM